MLKMRIKGQDPTLFEASTDMWNVFHLVPSFNGTFYVPTSPDVFVHNPKFTTCAGLTRCMTRRSSALAAWRFWQSVF